MRLFAGTFLLLLILTSRIAAAASIEVPVSAGVKQQQVVITFQNPAKEEARDISVNISQRPNWLENEKLSVTSIESIKPGQSTDVVLSFDVVEELTEDTGGHIELTFSIAQEKSKLDNYSLEIIPKFDISKEEPRVAACNDAVEAGADEPETIEIDLGDFVGRAGISWEVYTKKDQLKIYLDGELAHDTGCISGQGRKNFEVSGGTAKVEVIPNCDDTNETRWNFKFECPAESKEEAEDDGEHVLILSAIENTKPFSGKHSNDLYEIIIDEKTPGLLRIQEGKKANNGVRRSKESTGILAYPKQLLLGDSFSYDVSIRGEIELTNRYCRGSERMGFEAGTYVGGGGMLLGQMTKAIYGASDFVEFTCTDTPESRAPILEQVHLSGEHNLTWVCDPDGEVEEQDYLFAYPYHCKYQSSVWGNSDYWPTFSLYWPKVKMQPNADFLGENDIKLNASLVLINGFNSMRGPGDYQRSILRYLPKKLVSGNSVDGGQFTHSFELRPPWQQPDESQEQEHEEQVAQDDDRAGDSSESGADGSGSSGPDSGAQSGSGAQADDGSQDGDADSGAGRDLNDPNSINPNDPDIAGLIAQWIASAEPPGNAQHGHNFTYEQWGRFVGTNVDGGKITTNQKPDDVGAQTNPEYLWGKRDKLDSVDHCTLSEYVMSNLRGEGLSGCAARYNPIVPDFVGKSNEQAKSRLKALKLNIQTKAGKPAPTLEKSMTVERQEIKPGATLKKGENVALWLYLPYVEQVQVPKLVGKSSEEAKTILQKVDLKFKVELGEGAPSKKQESRVAAQNPEAGSGVKKATVVSLVVYGPYAGNKALPNVVGMKVSEAKQIVEFAGYKVNLKLGDEAPAPEQANTIQRQSPPGGIQLKPGATVTVYAYVGKVNESKVGEYVGMKVDQARSQIQLDGLIANVVLGEEAPSQDLSWSVHKQTPPAGLTIKSGGRVTVHVYSEFSMVVGDYRGLDGQAIKWDLEKDGLVVSLSKGGSAPIRDRNGTVQSQSPGAGTKIKPGGRINLVVYSDFVDSVSVPSIVGLSADQAAQRLRSVGLSARIVSSGAAPQSSIANTVAGSYPSAGQQVKSGTSIDVSVWGQYQPPTPTYQQPAPASGNTSLEGQWIGTAWLTLDEAGQERKTFNLQLDIAKSGATSGVIQLDSESMSLNGGARDAQVNFTGLQRNRDSDGTVSEFKLTFSGNGSGNRLSGNLNLNMPDMECAMGQIFDDFSAGMPSDMGGDPNRQTRTCGHVNRPGQWQATRNGPAPSNVDPRQLQDEIFRASLFLELVESKKAIDAGSLCGPYYAEARQTKQDLINLNQRFQNNATEAYRREGENLKARNQRALQQYKSCFAANLSAYNHINQAQIRAYDQHRAAYADLAREFGNVGELRRFIEDKKQQLRSINIR